MLYGKAGTGKTTFVQGLAMAIGIKERVGSPTFKLVSEYEGKDYVLYHIDAYRLEGVNDFLNIGGEEYLKPRKGITLIEWADIIEEIFDDGAGMSLRSLGEILDDVKKHMASKYGE